MWLFAGARSPDQDNILGIFHERAAVQLPDGGFVDLAGLEVKAREVLVGREARYLGLVGIWARIATVAPLA